MIETFTIISGLLALISIFKPTIRNDYTLLIFLVPLLLASGLRWEMGTDWKNYYALFDNPNSEYAKQMEPGYLYYIRLIKYFTDSYSVFLLLTDTIAIGGCAYLVYKYTKNNFVSLFYFTGTLFWYAGSLRQMLSLVILTYSLRFILNRNSIYFTISVMAACFFHKTSLFFITAYFIYDLPFTLLILILFFIVIFANPLLLLFDKVIGFLYPNVSIEFRINGQGTIESNPWLGIPRKLITFFGLLYFYKKITNDNKIAFYLKMASLSIFFYFIGTFYLEFVSSRMDIFTGFICTPILIGLIDNRLNRRWYKILLFLFVVSLNIVFYSRLEYLDLFHPYSSIFFNYDYGRNLDP